jgi:hypothetical protein
VIASGGSEHGWQSDDPGLLAKWAIDIPHAVVEESRAQVMAMANSPESARRHAQHLLARPAVGWFAKTLERALWEGLGFARLSPPAGVPFRHVEQRLLFLTFAIALGDVVLGPGVPHEAGDRDAEISIGSPLSMLRDRMGFHTDFADTTPDALGFWCERPALSGGEIMVGNGVAVREQFAQWQPQEFLQLQVPLPHEVRIGGADRTASVLRHVPVFARDGSPGGWSLHYSRRAIEHGHRRAATAVPPAVRNGLDCLDQLLSAPRNYVCFRLAPGEMVWLDNKSMLHDRSAYVDDRRAPRIVWRAWVRRRAP